MNDTQIPTTACYSGCGILLRPVSKNTCISLIVNSMLTLLAVSLEGNI